MQFKNKTKSCKKKTKEGLSITRRIIQDFAFIYYLLYIFFIFAALIWHPFFMGYHLADILVRSTLLRNLLQALWQPRQQLILTLILFFAVEYFFTLYAYV